MAGTTLAFGYYWPAATAGWTRIAIIVVLATALAWVNVRGVRGGDASSTR